MRKYHYIIVLLFVAGLSGCQKEFTPAPTDPPIFGESLLLKVAYVSDTDSIVSEFDFDGAGRFLTETSKIFDGPDIEERSISLLRDSSGKVNRSVYRYKYSGSDAKVEERSYLYNAGRVKYGIRNYLIGASNVRDSVVFTYQDKVSRLDQYVSFEGLEPNLFQYYEYTYDSRGNITQITNYLTGSNTSPFLFSTIKYAYDDKINPLYSNDDVLVDFGDHRYVSPNNMVSITEKYADPVYDSQTTFSYEYGPDNRPLKATRVTDGVIIQETYTYKK
jgi:hypothetical protein